MPYATSDAIYSGQIRADASRYDYTGTLRRITVTKAVYLQRFRSRPTVSDDTGFVVMHAALQQLNSDNERHILASNYEDFRSASCNAIFDTLSTSPRWHPNFRAALRKALLGEEEPDVPVNSLVEYDPYFHEMLDLSTLYFFNCLDADTQDSLHKLCCQYGVRSRLELAHVIYRFVALRGSQDAIYSNVFAEELAVIRRLWGFGFDEEHEVEVPTPEQLDVSAEEQTAYELTIENCPEEAPVDIPVSNFEKFMQKELTAKLRMKSITIEAVRAIVANAELATAIQSNAKVNRTCKLCGLVREGRKAVCSLCSKAFEPSFPCSASQEETVNDSVRQLKMHHKDMSEGRVLSYSTRCPSGHAQPSHVGVELELECTGSYSCSAISISVARKKLLGIVKTDGSLHNGVEFVTVPLPPKLAEQQLEKYCTLAKEISFKAKDTCGMHIHLNRKGFTDNAHIARFHNFFVGKDASGSLILSEKFLKAYVGERRFRQQMRSSGFAKKIPLSSIGCSVDGEGNLRVNDRYSMVSLHPPETVEVRFFAATTNISKANANIQFVVAVREFTRHEKFATWAKFKKYVKANETEYPDLLERVIRFDTVRTTDITNKENDSNTSGEVETVL